MVGGLCMIIFIRHVPMNTLTVSLSVFFPNTRMRTSSILLLIACAICLFAAVVDASSKHHQKHQKQLPITRTTTTPDYTLYTTGTPASELPPAPTTPLVVLMGGGTDIDEAFQMQIAHAQGGNATAMINVLILRTSGADGYNEWIMSLSPYVACVNSVVFLTRNGSNDPAILDILEGAGMVFIAGGDQSTYYDMWADTPLSELLTSALTERNMPIGGTSAGLAVLGDTDFSAATGGVESPEALANPYSPDVTLNTSLITGLVGLTNTITDTHFAIRDRMGRLMTFLARMTADISPQNWQLARAVGVQEVGAVVVQYNESNGHYIGTVVGIEANNSVAYFLQPTQAPSILEPNQPLSFFDVECTRVYIGGQFDMTTWEGIPSEAVSVYSLTVNEGNLTSSSGSVY